VGKRCKSYLFFTLHVYGCNGEESVFSTGKQNLGTSVLCSVEFEIGDPAFFEALTG
jgi:hypothetical protein